MSNLAGATIPFGLIVPVPRPAPARQAMLEDGTCPAPPHCPSLPSSESAYEAVSRGGLAAWGRVGRDMFLRGLLIWSGIAAYDSVTGQKDPYRLSHAIAGAAGIEVFVLAWTWLNAPKVGK